MPPEERPAAPNLPWRAGSIATMAFIASVSRVFLLGANRLHVHGLDGFLRVLDERKDPAERSRGLITVSNHISVVDDPGMWGALPLKYSCNPDNMRWALGGHDLTFRNTLLSYFFAFGQVLPTHRIQYSKFGGLFQPTMTQVIRLLSRQEDVHTTEAAGDQPGRQDITDPFSAAELTFTTNGTDSFPVPSIYKSRRFAWVHVFPEGRIHQAEDKRMRYFRWGIARMILESDPCPDMIPMFIDGFDRMMHESREFPRFIPRPGKDINVVFGHKVDMEAVFGDLRERWHKLELLDGKQNGAEKREVGVLSENLKYGEQAVELRKECTMRVRDQVLALRKQQAYPDEDPKCRLVDTWKAEGSLHEQGQMQDGTWVKDDPR